MAGGVHAEPSPARSEATIRLERFWALESKAAIRSNMIDVSLTRLRRSAKLVG
jgi:hypothetical protein